MSALNFLVVGVGGQGALLASDVLAEVGVRSGFDVKKAELHGMSQRGGSVSSHVRWGDQVLSPVISRGELDFLVALEKLEALRYLPMLRPGGTIIVGAYCIPPLSASSGNDHYPDDDEITSFLSQATQDFHIIPTPALAAEVGNVRSHNVVLLGALSVHIQGLSPEIWLQVIEDRVPSKYVQLNRRAFDAGRAYSLSLLGG